MSFSGSLPSIVNIPDHIKCTSLNNQQCMAQPTLVNLHPNKYNTRLRYYPFAANLDRCMGTCNTLNYLSNKVCVLSKTEDLNLGVFNTTTRTNESKVLTKHISWECKWKFDCKRCNLNQKRNNDKC